MTRPVLSLIHQDNAAAGVLGDAVREEGVELEEASLALGRPSSHPAHDYAAVLVMGGEMNVDETDRHPWLEHEKALLADLIERGRPLLGVCLGSQLVAEVAGAEVGPLPGGDEIGWSEIELTDAAADDPLLGGLPRRLLAFEWHGYRFERPPGAAELARGDAGLQAFRLAEVPAWGIQFHAEVTADTLADWLAKDAEEARAAGVDPDRLAEQNRREIARWNDVGRRIGRGLVRYAAR